MIRLLGRGLRALGEALLGTVTGEDAGAYEMWLLAARQCGVENLVGRRTSLVRPRRMEGVRHPLRVSITLVGAAGYANAIITIGGLPERIRLKHESIRSQASKMVGGAEVVLGDPEFDAEFFVTGDPFVVRGIFDGATRRMALTVFGRRRSIATEILAGEAKDVGIADGALVARFEDHGFPHPPLTPSELLGQALTIADRVARDPQEAHLGEVVRNDPLPAVRLNAIALLRDERPRHPETIAALEEACRGHDLNIRLAAATALGISRAGATLIELAAIPKAPDAVSAGAISELRSHLPADQAESILDAALRAGRTQTACACLETLSRSGPFAETIARVLVAEEDSEVALAAIRALGRCGTPAEVELLRDVEARYRRNGMVALAVRTAVAAIQTRQSGSAGQLSLSVDGRGHLSVPEESGQVSFPEDPDGTKVKG